MTRREPSAKFVRMMRHRAAAPVVIIASLLLSACASQGPTSDATGANATDASGTSSSQSIPGAGALRDVPTPPGLERKSLAPRQGDAQVKSRMTMAAIRAAIIPPAYLTPRPTTRPATSTQPAALADGSTPREDPPLAAQHAYLEGRKAWRERTPYAAITKLEAADRLAPNQPDILKLLGQIHTATGNKTAGSRYYELAVAADPTDPESLLALGKHALDQGRRPVAIAILDRALSLRGKMRDADPGVWPLIEYFLGLALDHEGYDAAATERLTSCLNDKTAAGKTTRLYRDLTMLWRQRSAIWTGIGDARHRLGDPRKALDAYQHAVELAEPNNPHLVNRLVYTHLRLGDDRAARALVIDFIQKTKANAVSLELSRYLVAQGSDATQLAATLEKVYQENNRPGALAAAIANLLGPVKGQEILRNHLAFRPGDRPVMAQLITLSLEDATGPVPAPLRALRATLEGIKLAPDQAGEYAGALIESKLGADGVVNTISTLPEAERNTPPALFVNGAAQTLAGQLDEAADNLARALKADPRLTDASVLLARLLVAQRRFDDAAKALAPLGENADPNVVALRVRILAETNRTAEAVKLLEGLLVKDPNNLDLIIQKSRLQQMTADVVGAERTLLDALDSRPQSENLYEALFELYESNMSPPDATQQWQRLMRRLLANLPQSRTARLKQAEFLQGSNPEQAERILRGLINENPRDFKALDMLADALFRSDRAADAKALIEEQLTKTPNERQLLIALLNHYRRAGDGKAMTDTTLRIMQLEPIPAVRAQAMATVYLKDSRAPEALKVLDEALNGKIDDPRPLANLLWRSLLALNRGDEADKRLAELIVKFPKREAELALQRASLAERRGQFDRAEAIMLDILRKTPEHPMTNNALGYQWADKGKNLERAKTLIQTAVNGDPDNAAYLDSLGWANYKLRDYTEAVRWLKRAQAAPGGDYPVILDHLGDSLYRAGDTRQAVEAWRRATALMSRAQDSSEDDPELKGLIERLQRKLESVGKNQAPPIADAPGKDGQPAPVSPPAPGPIPAPGNVPAPAIPAPPVIPPRPAA